MPKRSREMTAIEVKRLTSPGFHAVGGVQGLHLRVNEGAGRSWILRVTVGGKRRDVGLGSFPTVSLAQARLAAQDAHARIKQGIDPVEERARARAELKAAQSPQMTFADTVEAFLSSSRLDALQNEKHRSQWHNTLKTYALPIIGDRAVQDLTAKDILAVLEPIWLSKHETASRLRGRIESVLSWAAVSGHRSGENPAVWRGNLQELLPKVSKKARGENQPALQVKEAPSWFAALSQQEGVAARALAFLALTAARSGEVREATWNEIDLDGAMWIIPAKRMKAGSEHRVALSSHAMTLLRSAPKFAGTDLVFPSPTMKVMSDMTLSAVMKRMQEKQVKAGRKGWVDMVSGRPAVPHGLRSTFRDWVSEKTTYPRELAEIALAHSVGSAVEQAYRRGDMIEKRRAMMEDWAGFLIGRPNEPGPQFAP